MAVERVQVRDERVDVPVLVGGEAGDRTQPSLDDAGPAILGAREHSNGPPRRPQTRNHRLV
jgi:hypothetical protein